jgi:transcriptional regulator with XRE-family HTH domain
MIEPRSTATIRALASLAELSANQLEEGRSVEEVIATLRKAAEAVRLVVDQDELDEIEDLDAFDDDEADLEAGDTDIVQDLTPMDLSEEEADNKIVALDKKDAEAEAEQEEEVLNAG